ncbi:MAG: hypothetical protein COT89_00275 [Candidatus Colwellbacteria bacterium CG10_big_fil_rev_8_21_14_0_10_42_22]|uniref:ABC transporter ATP-binding protein n=1 Tax=Candidatus Colwellbacteria bacterium CG10_big_fil_rev_8_21_14_0_10_42_22 TaxID=1974540 RepID=A0A2H0VGE0_9BACT|nr:MAG: hypothetical protein COT89_00275 [Candidatus Colwellbacteria bacterium CG10_big_fil_rev_8_21_14_0_10_42_22]
MPKKKKVKFFTKGWRIIFRYLGEYKREILIISFLGVVSAIANGFVPYIVGRFFDAILSPAEILAIGGIGAPLWAWLLVLLGITQLIANFADWVNDVQSRNVGTLLNARYPTRAVEHLIRLPISFHKDQKTGEVWDKIVRGMNASVSMIERVVLTLAPQILAVFIGITIAFVIHPILASIIVFGVLLYVATLAKIVPPIVTLQKKGYRAWNRAFGNAYDTVTNVQTVKLFTAEEYESKKAHRSYIDKAARSWFKVEKIWSDINFYQRILIAITQILVFVFAVYFITKGELTLGGLIALNGYAGMVFGPFVRLGYNWEIVQNGIVAIERAEEILSTPREIYEPENALSLGDLKGKIEFKNVSFEYGKNKGQVLKGISFKIRQGEVVALVGESGVGKSTLVDLISGYYFSSKGSVLIDDKDIKKVSLKSLREQIAVVPQEVVLFNDTIENNIRYGDFKASHENVVRAAKEAHADIFINKFSKKYQQLVGERGIKLSVGQKQRIAIARAILRDPKILILDEPTSALDIETEKYIGESLEKLMKNRTTIIIAHRLSTVRRSNRILVFEAGKLIEQGTHEELVKNRKGLYHRLYKLHVGLG